MRKRKRSLPNRRRKRPCPGRLARTGRQTLRSVKMGALPIINRILQRLRLEELLQEYLPPEDKRVKVPAAKTLLVLVRNLLVSREPLYGIGEWAAGYAPDLLGLTPEQLEGLNDDGVGRALNWLFRSEQTTFVLAVVRHTVREFAVTLEQLHNDSTTITFHGNYADAAEEGTRSGQTTLAITWGHNKDHRPDLKQLLYILTVSNDGGVPVHFRVESGNTVDDQTHQETWELLCELAGRRDFLYVADCKLATAENMAYLHQRGGRFITVLPKTRGEDHAFRQMLRQSQVSWRTIHEKTDEDEPEKVLDRFSVAPAPAVSAEGYRLVWYHSTRKAELDAAARAGRIQRATRQLDALRQRITSPRTRYRQRTKVAEAVEEVLHIQALLCVYFLVLLVESLLERELRQAMEREGIESLPMYPEDRPCRHPTARRLIDRFDDIQRHTLDNGRDAPVVFVSELSDLHRRILKLLGVPASDYHG